MGRPNPIQEMCFELDICPDLLMALIATFAAGAFFFLYMAITMVGRRRRRRRSLDSSKTEGAADELSFSNRVHLILDTAVSDTISEGMSESTLCILASNIQTLDRGLAVYGVRSTNQRVLLSSRSVFASSFDFFCLPGCLFASSFIKLPFICPI